MGDVVELAKRRMPTQKPGKSKQDYATPKVLIDAVKIRFGVKAFGYDLAADALNTKARFYFDEKTDSLKQNWSGLSGDLWLNPPYSHIEPWAEKCNTTRLVWRSQALTKPRIFFLVPAAVGANWWARHVDNQARVVFLNGRISFDGVGPYPKDCAIVIYNEKPGYEVWRWR
jgi:phage N-6-adenine-methyltransferase